MQETKKISNDKLPTRKSSFLQFATQPPCSNFKQLIVMSTTLLQGLRKMSMLKMVPKGLKPHECEQVKLREPPPVPYMPEKDKVQDKVAKMRSMEIKTTIEKDTTLNFPVWQENGTRKAFLMHVTAIIDVIKKRGHFEDYDKARYTWEQARSAAESARAGLALLEEGGGNSKKSKKKTKEGAKEAAAKVPDP
jgi:hypothetical protein